MTDKNKLRVASIVFLILGFEIGTFCYKSAVIKLAANRDKPDTIYVFKAETVDSLLYRFQTIQTVPLNNTQVTVRRNTYHSPKVKKVIPKKVESFPFNPNTVSLEDLQRLGFTEKQATSIIHSRERGYKFRRKEDFASSFVVDDSVYARLEPYIRIPKIDINKADSATLTFLPGIGAFYASKIVEYREKLRGYSYPEQLMDIWKFDQEKYDGLKDLIICSEAEPYPLWTLPEEELRKHPYIGRSAKSIILYKQYNSKDLWTPERLVISGIIKEDYSKKFKRCRFASP